MVLGVYHFNSQLNQFRATDDVTTATRQQEIEEVVDCLVRFRPTKIAIERLQSEQSLIDGEYTNFLCGTSSLPANECYQLGFRTAKYLGHEQVYAIDMKNEQSDQNIGYVFDFAERFNPDLHKEISKAYEILTRDVQSRIETENVRQVLHWLNQQNVLQAAHQPYLVMTQVGNKEHRIGLDWVSRWYERNLTIYSNLVNYTRPDDRWLVIYGHGHARLLTQFLAESGKATLVSVTDYL